MTQHNPRLQSDREPPMWLQCIAAIVFGALWLVILNGFFL
jgi:hypothetical protein